MQKIFFFILISALFLIVVEDFRDRKISLVWLIGISVSAFFVQINAVRSFAGLAVNIFTNLSIIAIIYLCLFMYFSLKHKRLINLGNHYIGWGDFVFLITIAFLFSPINFLCFILSSLLFSLVYSFFAKLILSEKFKTIPLAGLQSLFLIIILAILFKENKIGNINNDQFTLSMILNYVSYN